MSFFGDFGNSTGTMEMGGSFELIPAKTQVKAAIEQGAWHTSNYDGKTVISLTWAILAPSEYAGRKVFQKLHVIDSDDKKRAKALQMLAAIDKNCGGRLTASGEQPTDADIMLALSNKPMVLLLDVWKSDDKSGNWVSAVSPLTAKQATPQPAANKFDDDIIF